MQIGIGEWKMRSGLKAVVLGRQPANKDYPWIGYGYDEPESSAAKSWSDIGRWVDAYASDHDIISPWTSPIAKGHNPDKLTEEQVGVKDGWRLLDRDEIKIRNHYPCHSWLRESQSWGEDCHVGAAIGFTYRTRLSREELAKLDKPKKRLIRVEELPPVCWVTDGMGNSLITGRIDENVWSHQGVRHSIQEMINLGLKWSSDLKTWNPFEVEEK